MFCTECGKPMKDNYKFCPHCGAPKDSESIDVPKEQNCPTTEKQDHSYPEEAFRLPDADYGASKALQESASSLAVGSERDIQENSGSPHLDEMGEGLVPPPLFAFEEEPVSPEEPADVPYFVYRPESDSPHAKLNHNKKSPQDFRSTVQPKPDTFLQETQAELSMGFKVLMVCSIVIFALLFSVIVYQCLYAKEPFSAGWFFGLCAVLNVLSV